MTLRKAAIISNADNKSKTKTAHRNSRTVFSSRRPSEDEVSHDGRDDSDARNGDEGEKLSAEDVVNAADAADDLDVQLEHHVALGLKTLQSVG